MKIYNKNDNIVNSNTTTTTIDITINYHVDYIILLSFIYLFL